jgi:hypothetical protein
VAKTEITTVDGIRITVDGTPDEVARILEYIRRTSKRPASQQKATVDVRAVPAPRGLPALIDSLREENFFKVKRALGDVSSRLAELGSHYSGTTLGKQLLREVRGRRLRRLRDDRRWVYVQ